SDTKQSTEKEETQLQQHQDTLLQTCKSHNYASSQVGNTNSETQVVNEQVSQNASQSNMRNSQVKLLFIADCSYHIQLQVHFRPKNRGSRRNMQRYSNANIHVNQDSSYTKQSMEKEETQLQRHQDTLLQTCKSHNYASSQVSNTNSETQVVNEQVSQNASQTNMRNSQVKLM
ncbi:hypothetical protein H5410_016515, partial [Solanum commersonii]